MRSTQKYWTGICRCDRSHGAMVKKLNFGGLSLPIAATESGASGFAERASMMTFGLCMCRATQRHPFAVAASNGCTADYFVSNRWPPI